MGIEAARRLLADALRARGFDSSDLDARLLSCAACGLDHAALIRDPDRALGAAAAATLAGFTGRRFGGEPVSRILGRRDFFGVTVLINAAVLDPRPDTEGVVAAALDAVGGRGRTPLRILDLGTGSGAILCALLAELPQAFGLAVDRSPAACRTAARNLGRFAPRALVLCGDWDTALDASPAGRFDLVVSNPPYVATAEIEALAPEVRLHDPHAALDGGPDGLDAYRLLSGRLAARLCPGGAAVLECGWQQGAAVAALMRDAGLVDVAVLKDLAGHGRVVIGAARGRARRLGDESSLTAGAGFNASPSRQRPITMKPLGSVGETA